MRSEEKRPILPACLFSSLLTPHSSLLTPHSSLFLQLHRQLIDLRGQDEVVLGQAADGVRREFDRHVAVAGQMQVRVVVFRLRKVADAPEEVKSGQEVLDAPFARGCACRRRSGATPVRPAEGSSTSSALRAGTPPSQGLQCFWLRSLAVLVMARSSLPGGRPGSHFRNVRSGWSGRDDPVTRQGRRRGREFRRPTRPIRRRIGAVPAARPMKGQRETRRTQRRGARETIGMDGGGAGDVHRVRGLRPALRLAAPVRAGPPQPAPRRPRCRLHPQPRTQ